MKLKYDDIMTAVRNDKRGSLSLRELMVVLRLPPGAKKVLHRQLRELERQRFLKRIKGGRYAPGRSPEQHEGVISIGRRGEGWIETKDGRRVRVPERFLGHSADGDRVRYVIMRRDRMNRLNGKVVGILERSGKLIVGSFQRGRDDDFILPVDATFSQPILVDKGDARQPQPGDWVVVRPKPTLVKGETARAQLVEVLGNPADPAVEMMATACRFSIPLHFSDAVTNAAAKISAEISEEDLADRKDLRDLPFVTIDGETARDFDDAVAVEPVDDGYRLYVAIADVSHFVPAAGIIDRSALERGTSVYFPGYCIPMLPEKLSNDLCSLKPDIDRLVMTAEILFSKKGDRKNATFYPAVIKSRARLTYNQVQEHLDHSSGTGQQPHMAQLETMRQLSKSLTDNRARRGSLELDIPEPEVVLDASGAVSTIRFAERLTSHRVIEEFMLAANEAVAEFLSARGLDFPYRIHEPPEVSDFAALNNYLAARSGRKITFDHDLHPDLQKLVDSIEEEAEKRVVSRLLLQSLKQARYSADNVGHYGLAADKYCHFTSPIRRYPDLLVHRILKQSLKKQGSVMSKKEVERIAELSSRRERLAVDAERDVQALLACRFMQDKVGRVYPGTISSVQKFGLFIELADFPVEGLIHVSRMEDDYYSFDADLNRLVGERTGHVYAIGNSVNIFVENVNIARREIDFSLDVDRAAEKADHFQKRGRRRKTWR